MKLSVIQMAIRHTLRNAKGPVTRRQLSRRIGISDRELRLNIADMRMKGEFITACESGGYEYGNKEARLRYLKTEWARIRTEISVLSALEGKK